MACNQVNCFFWEVGCQTDWSVVAAWAQAILSGFAIFVAGITATEQLKKQFLIDRVKRHKELLESQLVIAEVLLGVVEMIVEIFTEFHSKSTDAHKKGMHLRKHEINDLTHLFQDLLEDINNLSVYELRTKNLTKLFVAVRMNLRRVQFNCDLYFKSTKIYSLSDFAELDKAVTKGLEEIKGLEVHIKEEIDEIRKIGMK